MIYHVRFRCADDYMARRLPYRPAHLRQLDKLRGESKVVAGGPEPDGTYANIFYRVPDRVALDVLLADNEFNKAGLFVDSTPRIFDEFFEPLDVPPLDAGLQAVIVDGQVSDRARAGSGLRELQKSGRAAFGGFFGDGKGLVVVRVADADIAVRTIADAGGWVETTLRGRPWSQTL